MRRAGDGAVRRGLGALAVAATLLAVPAVALAQAGGSTSGFLVRVQGDLFIDTNESADLVVVVSGDAEVHGRAGAVVVIGGNARLVDARVGRLVVVRGAAQLDRGTVVEGDVWLAWAQLEQAPGATVAGAVHRGVARFGWGWLAVSPLLSVGLAIMVVGVGLLAVGLGPRRLRAASGGLTADPAGAVTWALLLFVVGPGLAVLAFFTVVGLPTSLVVLGLLLPVAGLAGFAVAGFRLGTWVLRPRSERPYGAAALGSALLLALGLVPVAGPFLVALAAALGAGALARTFGGEPLPAGRAGVGEAPSPAEEAAAGEPGPAVEPASGGGSPSPAEEPAAGEPASPGGRASSAEAEASG